MEKMDRNEDNVQKHKKRVSQQINMKQQKRMWKEKDIEITNRRQKRIKVEKQDNLITKEKNHGDKMKNIKKKENNQNRAKINLAIKELGERDTLMSTLTEVLRSNEDIEYRNRVLEDKLFDLKIV
mmetsp:Transcript_17005/g.14933  ORF Transcript_17005/g.14933 Transcript_17005/m.14933 type:complete len:125 (+) Transcript_17005:152-526(+)